MLESPNFPDNQYNLDHQEDLREATCRCTKTEKVWLAINPKLQ